jgi:hypothetical protein
VARPCSEWEGPSVRAGRHGGIGLEVQVAGAGAAGTGAKSLGLGGQLGSKQHHSTAQHSSALRNPVLSCPVLSWTPGRSPAALYVPGAREEGEGRSSRAAVGY